MTENEAFLEAIVEDPDDDSLRLIYADFLEEQGDPRGEFIRVQVALDALAENDSRWDKLARREQELLDRHGEAWLGLPRIWLRRWAFRRGFLGWVVVSPETYLEHAARLRQPLLRHVEVDLTEIVVPRFVMDQLGRTVRGLGVFPIGQWGRRAVVAVPDTQDMEMLARLNLLLDGRFEVVAAPAEQIREAIERHSRPDSAPRARPRRRQVPRS